MPYDQWPQNWANVFTANDTLAICGGGYMPNEEEDTCSEATQCLLPTIDLRLCVLACIDHLACILLRIWHVSYAFVRNGLYRYTFVGNGLIRLDTQLYVMAKKNRCASFIDIHLFHNED